MFTCSPVTILKPGDPAKVGPLDVVILGVDIRPVGSKAVEFCVKYECAWWTNDSRQTAWFHECEITPIEEFATVEIGFHTIGDSPD